MLQGKTLIVLVNIVRAYNMGMLVHILVPHGSDPK